MTPSNDSTSSAVVKEDLVLGSGASATAGDDIVVHYVGWLESGQQFDSSRARRDPLDFALGAGDVIKGWDQGIEGMKQSAASASSPSRPRSPTASMAAAA